jgi:hypothetical protein
MPHLKYQLMARDEYGHWTLMDIFSLTNSKKDIIDQLERCYSYKGATHIKNIDRGDILDMEVTWQNLLGNTIKKTFSYRWEYIVENQKKGAKRA